MVKEEKSLFEVKGRPPVNIGVSQDNIASKLKTILEQKLEEGREKQERERKPVVAYPGAEFKPEQTPFIPDSNHPMLSKHTLSTPARNAGYQDASMVPRMYRRPPENKVPPLTPSLPPKVLEREKSTSQGVVELSSSIATEITFEDMLLLSETERTDWQTIRQSKPSYAQVDKPVDNTPKPRKVVQMQNVVIRKGKVVKQQRSELPTPQVRQGKDKEFELKMPRENMHKGGHWVPNESRPYRPGD